MRLLFVLVLVSLSGCASTAELESFRDDLAEARASIAADAASLEAAAESIARADPTDPRLADAEASLATARAARGALDAAIAQLDAAIGEAESPSDGLTHAAHGLAPLLPEPLRLPLLLGAGLAVSLMRARQLKRAAGSIAQSLDKAMARDPELADLVGEHADLLRSVQTPTARRIVDEADGGRKLVRLPI